MEFETPKEPRILAGIQLLRRSEPTLELKPFIVTDLPVETRLQDVLLHRINEQDVVPELADIKAAVVALGGTMTSYPSAKEYFGAMFDLGITPLRLAVEEERTKLNEMLRTSMTGGISRTLTSDLRSFLLRPDGGLTDTLTTMRGNLDTCRQTRTDVQLARQLHSEIAGVYDAGQEMFATAFHATRERTVELRGVVEKARDAHETARWRLGEAEDAFARVDQDLRTVDRRSREAHDAFRAADVRKTLMVQARQKVVQLEKRPKPRPTSNARRWPRPRRGRRGRPRLRASPTSRRASPSSTGARRTTDRCCAGSRRRRQSAASRSMWRCWTRRCGRWTGSGGGCRPRRRS